MRAVMPRILRNAEGLPVKETHEARQRMGGQRLGS